MAEFFDRDFSITLGTIRIRARTDPKIVVDSEGVSQQEPGQRKEMLRVDFKVKKTLKKNPNQAEVTIYNLNREQRQALNTKGIETIIEAGFVGGIAQIFRGQLIYGESEWTGHDWVSTLQSGDGQKAYAGARINESLSSGATLQDAIKKIAGALQVDLGNAAKRVLEGDLRKGFGEFKTGRVLSGRASDELQKLVQSAGLTYSIQDGKLQLLKADETTNEEAYSLSKETGLVGEPESGDKNTTSFKSLMIPEMAPGRKVFLKSTNFNGFYKAVSVTHVGSTRDVPWYTEVEAVAV